MLRPKCTKFDFGWGSAPDPAGGAYSAHPGSLAGFRGPTSKGEAKEGTGMEGREKEEMVDSQSFAEMTPLHITLLATLRSTVLLTNAVLMHGTTQPYF